MGLFDFFKGPDFNEGIETYKNTKDAVLLDVRTQEEYLEEEFREAGIFLFRKFRRWKG